MNNFRRKIDYKDNGEYIRPLKRVIAIASQKGGVGKSTTAINVSAYLSHFGYKTIIIDLDPQSNSTKGLGIDYSKINYSVYNALVSNDNPNKIILDTSYDNLKILPASWKLSDAEAELNPLNGKEFRLRDTIEKIEVDYDYIIIDCSPHLGLLIINALAAAEEVIIPMQCEYYALEGVGRLIEIIDLVKINFNERLKVAGAVLTMYSNTRLAMQTIKEIKQYFYGSVFKTIIPRNVSLGEATSFCKPIIVYDPLCKGAVAYRNLTREITGNDYKFIRSGTSILPRKIRDFWITGSPPRHAIKRR